MRQNICVGMSFQPAHVRDLDAAQDEFSSLDETMHVITDSRSDHDKNNECRMTNDELSRAWLALFFRASCFAIVSSFFIILSNRSLTWKGQPFNFGASPFCPAHISSRIGS